MAPPRILIRDDDRRAQRLRSGQLAAPERAWGVVGWLGLLVGVVGLLGMILEWYPSVPGSLGSAFTAIVASIAELPIVTLGLLAFLAAAVARRRRRSVWRAVVFNLVVAATVLAMTLAFGALAPGAYALASAPSRLGVRKVVLKTAIYGLGLGFAQLAAALGAWRLARARAADAAE